MPSGLGEYRPLRRVGRVDRRQASGDPVDVSPARRDRAPMSAVSSEAIPRAATMAGCPGKATAVATKPKDGSA
jgi:hypothetical protein